ncbi:hypothetical protein [Helicobacter bilis]|nr:hypothetical protein [Helicobacter bilis]MCI7411619.1 hypothetical protein [Helicobacter bilis]MDD7295873.1 hypothetical protein [Helicobacter bilis]MDY4400630.1 hypothetical protein [Helicobacter bilis]
MRKVFNAISLEKGMYLHNVIGFYGNVCGVDEMKIELLSYPILECNII